MKFLVVICFLQMPSRKRKKTRKQEKNASNSIKMQKKYLIYLSACKNPL